MGHSIAAIILAAGEGKRMCSDLPKVLHPCADLPLLCHVVRLALLQGCGPIVVVVSPSNYQAVEQTLKKYFNDVPLRLAVQQQPHGTADATRAGLAQLTDFVGDVLILYGDVPLLQAETLTFLGEAAKNVALAFLTATVAVPKGYGRVLRNKQGLVERVVEEADATPVQRAICEVNVGVYWLSSQLLQQGLVQVAANNAQHEFYLTDLVAYAAGQHGGACAVAMSHVHEMRGVNTREELAVAESLLVARLIAKHQAAGVTFHDTTTCFVGVDVVIGRDVDIGIGVQLRGHTRIDPHVRIEGPAVIADSVIGSHSVVHAFSHVQQATLGAGVSVGPFARLRPQAHLADGVRIGNFVEIKNSQFGPGSKANHLAYVGDACIGANSNLGAGTITCNYDGFLKHRTVLGDGVFVGSNSTLVAPLEISQGAFVAAGSTITENIPSDTLAFGRARQTNRPAGSAKVLREQLLAAQKAKKEL